MRRVRLGGLWGSAVKLNVSYMLLPISMNGVLLSNGCVRSTLLLALSGLGFLLSQWSERLNCDLLLSAGVNCLCRREMPMMILLTLVCVRVLRRYLTSGWLLIGSSGPGAVSASGCTCLLCLVVRIRVWCGVDCLVTGV